MGMNGINRTLIGGAALLATLGTPALAQDNDTIQVFTRAELVRALDAINATHEPGEYQTINVRFENGMRVNAAFLACEDDETKRNCYGTSILASFVAASERERAAVDKAINEYNFRRNFGRAYRDPDGIVKVRMYIISDGGITRENYRRQIALWAASLRDFVDFLSPDN